jgi:signal transduction histidine kinase
MNASLRARLLLVVLLGGLAPLGLVGLWIARSGPQSGEALLRDRLLETMDEIVNTAGRNWIRIRTRLLDASTDDAVRRRIDGSSGVGLDTGADVRSAHGLADVLETLELVTPDGTRYDLGRRGPDDGSIPGAGIPVRVPVYAGPTGGQVAELVARVRAESVLPSDLLLSGVGGSILAALDGEGNPVLPQPIDAELLARSRFEWRGEPWVAVSQAMQEPPLLLVLAGPAGAFTEPFRSAARDATLALIAGSILAFLLVSIGAGHVTAGFRSLTKASEAVAGGNLAVEVPESGPPELRRVARAFNTMSASLERTLRRATQRETLAALGEYAASLAHEVRNPITSMRLDLERAADRLDAGHPSSALVRRAIGELDRLDASVSGALKLARTGKLDLADIDVREPIDAAMHAAKPRFADRGATVRTADWPADPVVVRIDAAAIEQLVLNLLLNAADALGAGGTALISIDETRDAVRIMVRDDGEGMPAERLARVFEPLFSTRPEGTGLGLPVARRIARAHGGDLRLESEPGSGTTARVTLPRAPSAPS